MNSSQKLFDSFSLFSYSWVVDTFFADSDLARVLQLGNYGWATDAIDTKSETTQTRLPGSKDND